MIIPISYTIQCYHEGNTKCYIKGFPVLTQTNSVLGYFKKKKKSFSSHFHDYLIWESRRGKEADSCLATKCQGFDLSVVSSFHHIITYVHTHTQRDSKYLSSDNRTDVNEPQRNTSSIWTQLPWATCNFPWHTRCPGIHSPAAQRQAPIL